jgi:hypothetical protein
VLPSKAPDIGRKNIGICAPFVVAHPAYAGHSIVHQRHRVAPWTECYPGPFPQRFVIAGWVRRGCDVDHKKSGNCWSSERTQFSPETETRGLFQIFPPANIFFCAPLIGVGAPNFSARCKCFGRAVQATDAISEFFHG